MERLNSLLDLCMPFGIGYCLITVFLQQVARPLPTMASNLRYHLAVMPQNFSVSTRHAVGGYFFSAGFNSTLKVAGAYLYIAPVELSVVEPKTPPTIMLPQNTGSNAVSATIVLGS